MPVLSAAAKRLSLASISSVSLPSPSKPSTSAKKHDQSSSAFSRQTTSAASAAAAPGNKMVSNAEHCLSVLIVSVYMLVEWGKRLMSKRD